MQPITLTISSGEIYFKRNASVSLILTSMNLFYLNIVLNIVSVAAVNRLDHFRNHHRHSAAAKWSHQTTAGQTVVDTAKQETKWNKICNIVTCSKCDKLITNRSISTKRVHKFCLIILNMPGCCHTERFVYGGF